MPVGRSPEDVTHLRAAFTNILDLIPGIRNVLPAAQGHEVGIFRKVVDSVRAHVVLLSPMPQADDSCSDPKQVPFLPRRNDETN
jgi:hypothetical protein